jgi:serine/threonine protein kinase
MPVMPLIGMDLGDYRLQAVLGRGGMSIVYRAENLRLGSTVAVKVLAPELALDDVFRERFIHESRIAASLNHPNVIPIFDAGPYEDLLFIAMRYVAGSDLRSVLKDQKSVLPAQALLLIEQTGRALDAAHKRGLVHRDVKPANILIERGSDGDPDHVYLADFGITKHALSKSGLTATGQFVGTIDYVAPEQILGKLVDGRCDIYSLGCVLYECLTGSVPFQKEHDAAVIWAQVEEAPPPATTHDPTLPPAVDDVIAKAMAKSPEDRYSTCREFVEAVRTALEPAGQATIRQPESLVEERPEPPELPLRSNATVGGAQAFRAAEEEPSTTAPQVTAASVPPLVPPTPAEPTAAAAPPLAGTQSPGGEGPPTPPAPERGRKEPHPRRRLLGIGAVAVVAALVGVGAWLALRGGGAQPAPARHSQPTNPIISALAADAKRTRGFAINIHRCKPRSRTSAVCTDPAPPIASLTLQAYPSLTALYGAYRAQVKRLSAPSKPKINFGDCQPNHAFGEVGWNHNEQHPKTYSLKQSMNPHLNGVQFAGRVFCTVGSGDVADVVWTDNDGALLAIASGSPHPDVARWWIRVHHLITPGMNMGSSGMKMGSTNTTSTDMSGMTTTGG